MYSNSFVKQIDHRTTVKEGLVNDPSSMVRMGLEAPKAIVPDDGLIWFLAKAMNHLRDQLAPPYLLRPNERLHMT